MLATLKQPNLTKHFVGQISPLQFN